MKRETHTVMKPTSILTAVLALAVVSAPAAGALVHQYTFEGGDASDAVGGLHGTVSGASINASDAIQGTYSAEFGGVDYNDHIAFSTTAFSDTAFSVAMWVKPYTVGTVQALVANKGGGTTAGFSMLLAMDDLLFEAVDASDTGNSAYAYDTMSSGSWQHVCFTVDGGADSSLIYHNGSPVTDDSGIQDGFVYGGPWRLGLLTDNGTDFWGRLDDVRIYDEVLSEEAIRALANNPNGVIPEPVTTIGMLLGAAAVTAYSRRRQRHK